MLNRVKNMTFLSYSERNVNLDKHALVSDAAFRILNSYYYHKYTSYVHVFTYMFTFQAFIFFFGDNHVSKSSRIKENHVSTLTLQNRTNYER